MIGSSIKDLPFLSQGSLTQVIYDDFNRIDNSDLERTPVGNRDWQMLRGNWDINSNQVRNISGTDSAVVVNARRSDVDIDLDLSSAGRDSIIFRASDENNWLRLSVYKNTSTSTRCVDQYRYRRHCSGLHSECNGVYPATMTKTSCGSCPSDVMHVINIVISVLKQM